MNRNGIMKSIYRSLREFTKPTKDTITQTEAKPEVAEVGNAGDGYDDLLLMEEILHHLAYIKPCKQWDIYHVNWCRISSINSMTYLVWFICVNHMFTWQVPPWSITMCCWPGFAISIMMMILWSRPSWWSPLCYYSVSWRYYSVGWRSVL